MAQGYTNAANQQLNASLANSAMFMNLLAEGAGNTNYANGQWSYGNGGSNSGGATPGSTDFWKGRK